MTNKKSWQVFTLTLVASAAMAAIPGFSFADSGSDPSGLGGALCDIADWFTGDTGAAIATIAIIFLGIAAFFGKVTWGLALMFAVGIFAIFGAGKIVDAIGDGSQCTGSSFLINTISTLA